MDEYGMASINIVFIVYMYILLSVSKLYICIIGMYNRYNGPCLL